MKLSIVTTLYQSEKYIRQFHTRATAVANTLAGNSFEIIFVNDGSPDDSLFCAVEVAKSDQHTTVVDLSRNFGHHQAMMTGLAYARGEKIFLIDSDLEESPEWLEEFYEKFTQEHADMVYGVQINRRGKWLEKFTGWIFYNLFRLKTGVLQPDNVVTARLKSRRYVAALLLHREKEINIGGLWIITGFKQVMVDVEKLALSPTSYSFGKKLSHLVSAITSFSSLPLMIIFYIGLLITAGAAVFSLWQIFQYFAHETIPDGYTSLIISIWFLSGLIVLFLGVQGIYIAKIFSEVKQRPNTIVREVYRNEANEMNPKD